MQNASYKDKRRFIIKLGKNLHKYGTPTDRLETHLESTAKLLGMSAGFMVTPTSINFLFQHPDEHYDDNHIARVKPGELDLGALARADAVVDKLACGMLTLAEADQQLDDIAQQPSRYSPLLTLLAFAGGSAAFALLSHGSWHDIYSSALVGIVVFALVTLAQRYERVAYMLEPLAAITAAFLICCLNRFDPAINVPLVILASIIVLIPGLALLQGLAELSAKHLVSGSARVMDALMQMFKLYFGSWLGIALASSFLGPLQYQAVSFTTTWSAWVAVATLSITLTIILKARRKDIPWMLASGCIAYGASLWGAAYFGIALGAFIGAFAVGIFSNLYARMMKSPALIPSLPGLVVLVPGSKIFILLNRAISGQEQFAGDQLGQQAFLVFMSLVAGIIFANVITPPKRSL
ncbi:threonine/serine exporter family protein [Dasania sp. GY-MA-18]|uniref:Threonine/serine exporter family protein n=1 Tax=Dasania phycosphaerae TaxID=2950436 RepID=A0A9J6RRZ4_9GAMM|nr:MULTISPECIES: threonine/serine exporter family protein [Dasania]MCR8924463.1 threonine/serine exporter family protein [Dasania sp. GY-MA-18]MCZ0867138.1 threonine/serine exporter family protein [Dasania phycosphaerae]MCZ0870590.1 threonine/serine exporter family protein [Dasania phycosphaerae]